MYISEDYLRQVMDLPVSLPSSLVNAANWLVVASIDLPETHELLYQVAGLQLLDGFQDGIPVDIGNVCTPVDIELVSESKGLAYLGIALNYSPTTLPSQTQWVGTAADIIQVNGLGLVSRDQTAPPLVISNPGIYSWILVNNCLNLDLRLCVTAQVRRMPKEVVV